MPARRIRLGNLTIDRREYATCVGDRDINLTFVEFELLYILAGKAGKVISREQLLTSIWQDDSDDKHKLTVHISRLRRKLRGSAPWSLETVMKRGYILRDNSHASRGPSVRKRTAMKTVGAGA
jgi:DNA-binding response OmpR family regulator